MTDKNLTLKAAIIDSNGDSYEGQWDQFGQKSGQGKLIMKDGTIYEGSWANDMFDGIGCLT